MSLVKTESKNLCLCSCSLSALGIIAAPKLGDRHLCAVTSFLLLFEEASLSRDLELVNPKFRFFFICKMMPKVDWVNKARLMKSYLP